MFKCTVVAPHPGGAGVTIVQSANIRTLYKRTVVVGDTMSHPTYVGQLEDSHSQRNTP